MNLPRPSVRSGYEDWWSQMRCTRWYAVMMLAGIAVFAPTVASASIPPGVQCAGTMCWNDTDEPLQVTGSVVCPGVGPFTEVQATVPPHGSTMMPGAACPNGEQPVGINY
ncbi:hypothetical protein [Nocardia sp. CDC160]|uniref:hypothetical protein n=1 Tax=Nocardia sp. CDC160 TaxID=3112166 RepID=UPI002DB65CAE|nr:hypothetical protein [Nocardia sp. CDC160]MEC3918564.1 hypothetical protein [Nocardia sp. CDC160]